MKKRLIYVIFPAILIVLEILPYGAVLNFGRKATDGSIGYFRETYSYFDLLPFGYGHFGCLITAVLTCILMILGVIYLFKDSEGLRKAISVLSFTAFIVSLSPFILGIRFVSIVGILISVILIWEFIFLKFITIKKK